MENQANEQIISSAIQTDIEDYQNREIHYNKFINWLAVQVDYKVDSNKDLETNLKELSKVLDRKFEILKTLSVLIDKVDHVTKNITTGTSSGSKTSQTAVTTILGEQEFPTQTCSTNDNMEDSIAPFQPQLNINQGLTLSKKKERKMKSRHKEDSQRRDIVMQKFYCKCGHVSKSKRNLKIHCRHYNQRWKFKCTICSKIFPRKTNLKLHQITNHK